MLELQQAGELVKSLEAELRCGQHAQAGNCMRMQGCMHAWGSMPTHRRAVHAHLAGHLAWQHMPRSHTSLQHAPHSNVCSAHLAAIHTRRELHDEELELEARNPPAPERLRKVQRWAAERALALQVQAELVEEKQLELISVEASLRQAEKDLDFMADAQEVCVRPCGWLAAWTTSFL
eukprot:353636-Chlamydomonas_euryale.AAC.2